ITRHSSLEDILDDPRVDFISLCSPRRADQAQQAIRALRKGKHVLAEKPCATTEEDLDAILQAATESTATFHEMAGTAFDQPYLAMRKIVLSGQIGEVVQVIAEKSYPYYEGRPQDEEIDGGLIAQNGVHALRFIEHVACTPIVSITATETTLGNPVEGGGLRMASTLSAILDNGGLGSIACNYLNQPGTGVWGDESLKILGTRGLVESRAGGKSTRLVVGDQDLGPLDTSDSPAHWFDTVIQSITQNTAMPLSLPEELSPTRWVLRAKATV
ncbi:MAG: Gfo/Idh/MocA family protein, partial [Puniceicoccales bacterium]